MEKLIRGEITRDVVEELRQVLPKKNLMVFVSSTFLDTNLERDILHRKILAELQTKAHQHNIQVILYDMRFGVKDENTLNHLTWETCKNAIQQCHKGSDALFFLSLQSDRYGYLPLPKYLDEVILSAARLAHENNTNFPEITKVLNEWYRLDENHCPARFELKRLSVLRDLDFEKAIPILKNCLLDSVTFENLNVLPEEIVVNRSVTEWETFYGLDCEKERCYWIQRIFNKSSLRAFRDSADCWKITDIFDETETAVQNTRSTAKKLEVLHEKMKMYLRDDQRIELLANCSPEGYLKGEGCEEYLSNWERVTRDCLEKELKKVIDKSEHWHVGFPNIPVDHREEILHHCLNAFEMSNTFFGREELLQKGLEMMKRMRKNEEEQEQEAVTTVQPLVSGICLAVVGKSGYGKTALMAKLAVSCASDSTASNSILPMQIPMIIRFCGTSRYSLNGLKLIQSISLQIVALYENNEELNELVSVLPSQDYKTAVEYFQKLVSKYPIYLLIDSLDQLENRYEERSKLTFLRDLKPHEQSRIVVSTLPDEYEMNGNPGKYFYHCERTLMGSSIPILEVGIMDQIEVTIKSMLTARDMKLTNDQWVVTLQAVSHEPTILYINLAMEVISQWRSFEEEVILTPTVKGLIHQIFDDIELSYGKKFTSIVFAMITFSREGVNDPELQDLLSLHEGVMTEVCQYSKLHCFPMHAWLRLKQVIKNLATEKENHCIKWYHRQLWETASERYSEKEKECHEVMGQYFANLYDIDLKKEKDIMAQPLTLNKMTVWIPESIVNRRRVMEGYYHLIKGGLLHEAVEEVCSLEFVCCSALAGDLSNCVRYLGELVRLFNHSDVPHQLNHYYRWVRKRATRIVLDPRRQARMTAGEEPLNSVVKNQITQLDEWERTKFGHTLEPMTFGCAEDFDALELELVGHSSGVNSVDWSNDGSKILSGSWDQTIKIWDGMTGELLNTLEGHSGWVQSVSWNHDSSRIVSGSFDGTIKIWDVVTCELLMTLSDGTFFVYSVSWNHDSDKIASASNDGKVTIWNAATGKRLRILSGHTGDTRCVSWNHDDTKILSGSDDTTIKMWNSANGELLKSLESHFDQVTSVSWNGDSSKIVSGSKDETTKIWDGTTGALLKTLKGHSEWVHTVIWNSDGSKILSGSHDDTIKVWNAVTGELEETMRTRNSSIGWNSDCSRMVSGSSDGPLQVWDSAAFSKKSEVSIASLSGWNPDDRTIASGSEDGTIRIWHGVTGQLLRKLKCHPDVVTSVEWNHDGTRMASCSTDKTIKIWDGVTYELLLTLKGQSESGNMFSWNNDSSRILSVSYGSESEFFLWDGKNGELLKTANNSTGFVRTLSWNHDSTKMAIGYKFPSIITIWDETMTIERQLCTVEHLYSVSWNHESSKLVSGSCSKIVQVWDAESGALLKTLTGHSSVVSVVFWNHDGSKIFTGSWDATIRIWDGTTGQLLNTESAGGDVKSMSLTKEGDRLVFSSGCDPFLRYLTTSRPLKPLK
jgi:WD40 repeat protein